MDISFFAIDMYILAVDMYFLVLDPLLFVVFLQSGRKPLTFICEYVECATSEPQH